VFPFFKRTEFIGILGRWTASGEEYESQKYKQIAHMWLKL